MRELLTKLSGTDKADESEILSHTEWLEDASDVVLEAIYADYRSRAQEARRELEVILGPPAKTVSSNREWFEAWYPEAFEGAAWRHGRRWVCIAAEHADRETPVLLQLRSITPEALDALRQ
jgi:hypothetical protein